MKPAHSFTSTAIGILGLRLIAAGSVYLTQVMLARWLGRSALGTYAFASSLLIVLGTLSGLGLPTAATRFLPRYVAKGDGESVSRYLKFARIVGFGCGSTLGVVGWLGGEIGLYPVSAATLVALVGVPLFALLLVNSGAAHGLSAHHLSAVPNSARPLGLFLLVVAMWGLGMVGSVANVITGHLVVIIGVLAAQTYLLARTIRRYGGEHGAGSRREKATWLRTSSGLMLVGLTSTYLSELVILVTNISATPEELAVLNAVLRTAALLLFAMVAVDHVALPEYSTWYGAGDRERLIDVVRRATQLRLAAAAIGATLLLFAGPLILRLFGPGFGVGYWPLAVALTGLVLRAGAGGAAQLIVATSGTHELLGASVIGVVLGLVLNIATASISPVMAGALAFGSASAATAWMSRSICIRRLGFDPSVFGSLASWRRNRPYGQ